MTQKFTGIFQKKGKWFIGWVEEIPGVNSQGKTIKEARENLQEALELILDANKIISNQEIKGSVTKETLVFQRA